MTHPKCNRRLAFLALALSPVLIAPLWVDSPFPAQKPQAPAATNGAVLMLPKKEGSVRFAVMGDTGRGTREQNEVGRQMAAFHKEFPFDFVIMLGDNIYGADTPADMVNKFTTPYKALLDAGVTFHAALGNHDNPNQRFYKPFNMGGERFYTFRAAGSGPFEPTGGGVRFFALDTDYLDAPQLAWIEKELASSNTDWKIPYFHHPLYSSGGTHGSALETRAILEPLFVKYGVSACFSGHDHFYERIKPQTGGIGYWVSGGGGSLRKGDIRRTDLTAKGFDTDYHFMIIEIAGDDMYFQAISRTGATVDSGVFHRPGAAPVDPSALPTPKVTTVPVDAPVVGKTGRSTPEGTAALPEASTPTPTPTPTPKPTPKKCPTLKGSGDRRSGRA